MDPWRVLGVRPGATDAEIRAAYRRLAALHHPDRPGGDARRMAEINAALAAIRGAMPDVARPPAGPSGVAPSAASRPLGCAAVAAVAAVIVAATIAVAMTLAARDGRETPAAPTAPTTVAPRAGAGGPPQRPPWAEPALPRDASPLATNQWRQSQAAETCPLLVPAGADAGGTTRALEVEDGWGVSWGRPNDEELFGITARPPSSRSDRAQPDAGLRWTDGSTATLRRDGRRLVADLTIAGVECRYGVFSTLGFDHLAEVLGALRFVRT